jgi:predicted nucleic acid-binding protein
VVRCRGAGGNAGVNGLLFQSAIGAAFFAFAAVLGAGGKLLSYETASEGGSVALDTNVLIALEGGEVQAVDDALAGRIPVISITAAKEFLQKGNVEVLRQFLTERGGGIGPAALQSEIEELQVQAALLGRVLKAADAAVAASAIKQGIPLLTRDSKLVNFLLEVGELAEKF